MRNIETRTTKTGPDDAGLNLLLTEARKEERQGRADVMAARLDSLAARIVSRQLNHTEAAELLRQEAVKIQNEAQELHCWLIQWTSYSSALKKNASATSTPPAIKRRAFPVFSALIAMRRSRQLAAAPFRACSAASPVRKFQS